MRRRTAESCHDRLLLARHHWQDALHEAKAGRNARAAEFAKDAEMYLREAVRACGRKR